MYVDIHCEQIFGKVFHLSPGQISLQFIALLIGAVLGEQLAGLGSDLLVNWRTELAGGLRVPEYRLPLAYPGFVLSIVGIISKYMLCVFADSVRFINSPLVWGVQLQNATPGVWNVTPVRFDLCCPLFLYSAHINRT